VPLALLVLAKNLRGGLMGVSIHRDAEKGIFLESVGKFIAEAGEYRPLLRFDILRSADQLEMGEDKRWGQGAQGDDTTGTWSWYWVFWSSSS
jgi:hypothetical protein